MCCSLTRVIELCDFVIVCVFCRCGFKIDARNGGRLKDSRRSRGSVMDMMSWEKEKTSKKTKSVHYINIFMLSISKFLKDLFIQFLE